MPSKLRVKLEMRLELRQLIKDPETLSDKIIVSLEVWRMYKQYLNHVSEARRPVTDIDIFVLSKFQYAHF